MTKERGTFLLNWWPSRSIKSQDGQRAEAKEQDAVDTLDEDDNDDDSVVEVPDPQRVATGGTAEMPRSSRGNEKSICSNTNGEDDERKGAEKRTNNSEVTATLAQNSAREEYSSPSRSYAKNFLDPSMKTAPAKSTDIGSKTRDVSPQTRSMTKMDLGVNEQVAETALPSTTSLFQNGTTPQSNRTQLLLRSAGNAKQGSASEKDPPGSAISNNGASAGEPTILAPRQKRKRRLALLQESKQSCEPETSLRHEQEVECRSTKRKVFRMQESKLVDNTASVSGQHKVAPPPKPAADVKSTVLTTSRTKTAYFSHHSSPQRQVSVGKDHGNSSVMKGDFKLADKSRPAMRKDANIRSWGEAESVGGSFSHAGTSMEHISVMELRNINSMAKECWACGVTLRLPKGQTCWYAMHSHLLLQVPVCSVCAETIADLEAEATLQRSDTASLHEEDDCPKCFGCGDVEGTLLLCDGQSIEDGPCGLSFCTECVVKAHGGSNDASAKVEEMIMDDSPWMCLVCNPPAQLLHLRRVVLKLKDAKEERTVDFLLGELATAEEEKKRCSQELDTLDKRRDEIIQDIKREHPSLNDSEVDDKVAEEFSFLEKTLLLHDRRIDDFIAELLDELDAEYNFSATMCYDELEGVLDQKVKLHLKKETKEGSNCDDDASDDSGDSKEEEWVKQANAVVKRRHKKVGNLSTHDPLPEHAYTEMYVDVEELGDCDEDLSDAESNLKDSVRPITLRKGWTKCASSFSSAQLKEAMDNEMARPVKFIQISDKKDKETILRAKKRVCIRNEYLTTTPKLDAAVTGATGVTGGFTSSIAPKRHQYVSTSSIEESKDASPFFNRTLPSLSEVGRSGSRLNEQFPPESNMGNIMVPTSSPPAYTIAVPPHILERMKPHQIKGVEFMWRNCCADFAVRNDEGQALQVGGCVLAHHMGLVRSTIDILL
jgi:hypothetical protein